MSEQVLYIGKLKKICFSDTVSLEEKCRIICEREGVAELSEDYDSWYECLNEEFYDKYFIYKNNFFGILSKENMQYTSFCTVTNEDYGVYNFVTSYYNGGASFGEMIEEGLNELGE